MMPAPWSGAPDAWCELSARRARARWEREARAERRAEARMTGLVVLFVVVAGMICTVVDWALAMAVVHP